MILGQNYAADFEYEHKLGLFLEFHKIWFVLAQFYANWVNKTCWSYFSREALVTFYNN